MKQNANLKKHDFDWIMDFLGIKDSSLISQYKSANRRVVFNSYNKVKRGEEPPENPTEPPSETNSLCIFLNAKFPGNAAAHFIPKKNIIEVSVPIDESKKNINDIILVAHEFAHAIIGGKDIPGNRGGHGVMFFYTMLKEVVWKADNIPLPYKLRTIVDEFSYSCSLGIYKVVERMLRSPSRTISLSSEYFSINDLLADRREDIKIFGKWLLNSIKFLLPDFTEEDVLNKSIYEIVFTAVNNIDDTVQFVKTVGKTKGY